MKHLLLTTIAAVLLVGCKSTSIHKAAGAGNIEAVKHHLATGTDVNAKKKDKFGLTPLHIAAIEGHKAILKLLIAKGANVNAKDDEFGSTPLHSAVLNTHKEIVELLIAKGADVNAKDNNGVTPLHITAEYVHKEIAELLIAEGADVNAQRDDGETPLDWAIEFKETEITDLLRKHGGKTGVELSIHKAAEEGNIEAVKQHLDAGADVNAKEVGDKWTPLHNAAWGGHKEIAELLIAKGADVNAKDDEGMTPLHPAAAVGHREIAVLLIAKGVDVNAKVASGSKQGLTALDAANEENHAKTADLLRKHGGKTAKELKAE